MTHLPRPPFHRGALDTAGPSAHTDPFVRDALAPRALWPTMDYGVLPELAAYPDRLNAAHELVSAPVAAGHGERPAIWFDDRHWTLAELDGWSNRVAAMLTHELGLEPGNRVLLRAGNHPWLAACWYGALKAGAIPIATMPVLRASELAQIIDKAKVQYAIADHRLAGELAKAAAMVDAAPHTLTFGDQTCASVEARAARACVEFDCVDTRADDVAIIGFTSGSTGRPKGTVHFHRDLLAAADCFVGHTVGIQPGDIVCGSPQAAFLYGLCAYLIDAPRFGASVVLADRVTPEGLLQIIERYRATVCFSTPSGYKLMLENVHRYDLSSLRLCIAGGEPLAPAVHSAWLESTGCSIINGLGISELLHIFISASGEAIRPGAIGKAVPGFDIRVVNENFEDVAPGEIGQMIVRGPNGCRYLDDLERQRAYVHEGWNLSGDLCRIDEAGYIYYHSRSDDMIVTAGYNVAGPEVEAALLAHRAVRECAVVAAPDADRGQIVKAFVVLAPQFAPSAELASELQDFVKAHLAPFKYPRAVEFATELPHTASGKVRRGELRDRERRLSADRASEDP